MVTRLYWHNTSNGTTGLPTTKQSTQTVAGGLSQSVNKNMTTTIGTSQTSLVISSDFVGNNYYCRWVSDTLSSSSIAANTWTISFAALDQIAAANTIAISVYVWRPSTTTKIGTIFDNTIALGGTISSGETGFKVTFSGSAIASGIVSGDVICIEFMIFVATGLNGFSLTSYYDGTTVVTSNATSVSSVASYLETPETITLGVIPPVDATSTTISNLTNKFITKI
jgi:hypothetical protein